MIKSIPGRVSGAPRGAECKQCMPSTVAEAAGYSFHLVRGICVRFWCCYVYLLFREAAELEHV